MEPIRLALIADIHGNLPALEAVVADMQQFAVDQVVVAGDSINGPFSQVVLEYIEDKRWSVIRGNSEFYLLDYGTSRARPAWQDKSAYPLIPWLCRQIEPRWRKIIAAWPDTLSLHFPNLPAIRVFHGCPDNPWQGLFPTSPQEIFEHITEPFIIVAHSHLPMAWQTKSHQVLNPGPVGIPTDGIAKASYLLLEGCDGKWKPLFRRVNFDYVSIYDELKRLRFVEECGVIGQLVIDEFRTARMQLMPFNAWRTAVHPGISPNWELLAEFRQANIWDYTPMPWHVNISEATF